MVQRYRSTRDGVLADLGRAIAMATGGAIAFAPVEYALTLWAYPGPTQAMTKLKLVALVATLTLWLWLVLAVVTAVMMIAARALRASLDPAAGRAPGWFAAGAVDARGVRAGVPRLWAGLATAGVVAVAVQRGAAWAIVHYKEPQLTGVLVAAIALVAIAIAIPLARAFAIAAELGAETLAPLCGRANPLGRWRAAGLALALFVGAALATIWSAVPTSRQVMPARLFVAALVIGLGMGLGAWPRRRPRRARRRSAALALAAAALALQVATFLYWGADLETKYVAITASPPLDKLIALVRYANDLDGDGYGSLLGENDCDPFDSAIHPGAIDIPDDGIDQNCDGHDFSLKTIAAPSGPTLPVPPAFKKDWNVLFITIDTLRYDHTTFGGYADSAKHRDTTPRLAELVKRSTSFAFTQAPSAGTMASIPAIITSKYFHSGIALDIEGVKPGDPPRLRPENTLFSEIMKRGGYHTGVIASHEYWNDWGMEQGVDEYDNSIGKTPDPWRVAADKSTDHALAWISRNQGTKWWLWVHYIDPHGRYVAHPDVVDYGSSEPDLYDAEIKWTDQQIGRLLDELVRLPSYDHTIVVITSDHGDSMGEHTVPVGTHGTALYYELLHVPMIFYVPDNAPHVIHGATSNLDIVPTIAEICGIDVHDLAFEGKSQVAAIFYGKEDRDRIVFSETNAPQPQRAAISEQWKLIYYLTSNHYELFDVAHDPGESRNLALSPPPEMDAMKRALDGWLERVVYARDATFNQQTERTRDVLLGAAPTPALRASGLALDGGKLAVVGADVAVGGHVAPGAKIDIHVYFEVRERTRVAYRFQLVAWPVDPASWKPTDPTPGNVLRTPLRATADGFFPTERWRAGEHVRERFPLTIPANWAQPGIAIAVVAVDADNQPARSTAAAPANEPSFMVLGALAMPTRAGSSAPATP